MDVGGKDFWSETASGDGKIQNMTLAMGGCSKIKQKTANNEAGG